MFFQCIRIITFCTWFGNYDIYFIYLLIYFLTCEVTYFLQVIKFQSLWWEFERQSCARTTKICTNQELLEPSLHVGLTDLSLGSLSNRSSIFSDIFFLVYFSKPGTNSGRWDLVLTCIYQLTPFNPHIDQTYPHYFHSSLCFYFSWFV